MTDQAIDFTAPAPQAQALAAAKEATASWVGHITLGRRTYQIMPKLPTAVAIEMEEAQSSGDPDRVVDSFINVLRPAERADARAYVKADDFETDDDIISIDDLVEAVKSAQEQMAARPTSR